MNIAIKVDIPVDAILQKRGLGRSNEALLFLANEVKRLSDPYTPFQSGALKSSGAVSANGSAAQIKYNTPYAHYQWAGKAMGGRAPKHYTGASLQYHGGGMRGKEWTKRMMADRKSEVIHSFARKIGGRPG